MQDKELHIDKKFTNHAWAEMRKVLDKEMPVADKRRRFGWWWVLVGLAAFLAIGIAAIGHFYKPNLQTPKMEKPVAYEKPAVEGDEIIVQAAGTAADSEAEVAANVTVPLLPRTENFKPRTQAALQKPGTDNKLIANNSNDVITSVLPGVQKETVPGTLSADEIVKMVSDEELTPVRAMTHLPAAENLPLPALATLESQPDFEGTPVNNNFRHDYPVELSAFVGGMATPSSLANGLDAGVTVGLPLSKGRFTIEGGPAYSFVQQPLYVVVSQGTSPAVGSFEVVSDVYISTEKAISQAEAVNGFNNVTKVNESLQMHYANFPLRLKFRATPRIQIHGGFSTGILLASSPGYTGGGILNGFDQNLGEEYNLSSADQLEDNSVTLSKFDYAAIGGIRYQANRRLSLDLHYQAGLKDLIKSNKEKEYNRFFNLSLYYSLLGKN